MESSRCEYDDSGHDEPVHDEHGWARHACWTHVVRCRCGAFIGEVSLYWPANATELASGMITDGRQWVPTVARRKRVSRGAAGRIRRVEYGARSQRRRGLARGVQWECRRGCRLPSTSLAEVAETAEAEYHRGRRVIHV